jgi:putative MATE family efflux protein
MKAYTKAASIFSLLKQAISGSELNFTEGSINRAIFLLSVPMIIEMAGEAIFAVVDIYFVGLLHDTNAVAAVGLTESILTFIYSIGMGLSMGATAMIARRVGEKNQAGASNAAMQAMYIGLAFSLWFAFTGLMNYEELMRLVGASEEVIKVGSGYTKWMLGGNITIIMLFLINGIFRGAGNAAIAMKSLLIANFLNILLDPVFIFGFGPIPGYGVEGAAIATNIGRGIGVLYQLYYLVKGTGVIRISRFNNAMDWPVIGNLLKVSAGGAGQFLISSTSWVVLIYIMAKFGSSALAGYTIAIRVIIFTILPAWGMANAASTLVGQNLGAGLPDRAETSVWRAGVYNMFFLLMVMVVFLLFAENILSIFTQDAEVIAYGVECLQYVAFGYVFYGYGMVIMQAFNGAADTLTPTIINLVGFWVIQIPLAWVLALTLGFETRGVYLAIAIAESAIAVAAMLIFRRGKWKLRKI